MAPDTAKEVVRIDLTTTQKQQVKTRTGHNAEAIELTVEELEERITPKLASNHNEAFLFDG